MAATHYFVVFLSVLMWKHDVVTGSLHLDVTPANISPGVSTALSVTCNFSHESLSSESTILSLILSKDVSQTSEAQRFLELISVNVFHADRVLQLTQIEASVAGRIDARDGSYLALNWTAPSEKESGLYRCEVRVMDRTGHCTVSSENALVSSTQPQLNDLIKIATQFQVDLALHVESSNLLHVALERIEKTQNKTILILQSELAQIRERDQECEQRLLPRTCKDVVSEDPRPVVILRDGLEVMCDTQTDGGGWLVIQRRVNGEVDFYRSWDEYKYGFGNITGEFWFGNEKIHRLTAQRHYELYVEFGYNDRLYYAKYSSFSVYGEPENYKLKVAGYSGNAGDTLSFRGNNMAFTTKDRDNDLYSENCAVRCHGAFWYEKCHLTNFNGVWGSKEDSEGLNWYNTTGYEDSASWTELKIRPVTHG